MRLVLAGLTVVFAIGVELLAYPTADASIRIGAAADDTSLLAAEIGEPQATLPPKKGDRLVSAPAEEQVAVADETAEIASDEVEVDGPRPELTTAAFCEALTQAAEDVSLPPAFFARLIWQESRFKHDARSPVGAQGVAQFMPATAAEVGLSDPLDPLKALPASAKFLRRLHDQFGNLGLAAAAYNAGPGRIQNWLARRGPLPDETRNYVRIITGNAAENWTSESKTVGLEQQLPNKAPCEGVGGLSRSKEARNVPVALTPAISELIRKARVEAARVAAAAAAAKKLQIALKKNRKTLIIAMKGGSAKNKAKSEPVRAAAAGHRKSRDSRVKVASAAR
jgi:soluble lytic murein transglycosylase-like protein